jgi:hypothetical protein
MCVRLLYAVQANSSSQQQPRPQQQQQQQQQSHHQQHQQQRFRLRGVKQGNLEVAHS